MYMCLISTSRVLAFIPVARRHSTTPRGARQLPRRAHRLGTRPCTITPPPCCSAPAARLSDASRGHCKGEKTRSGLADWLQTKVPQDTASRPPPFLQLGA